MSETKLSAYAYTYECYG